MPRPDRWEFRGAVASGTAGVGVEAQLDGAEQVEVRDRMAVSVPVIAAGERPGPSGCAEPTSHPWLVVRKVVLSVVDLGWLVAGGCVGAGAGFTKAER